MKNPPGIVQASQSHKQEKHILEHMWILLILWNSIEYEIEIQLKSLNILCTVRIIYTSYNEYVHNYILGL